MNFSLYKPNSKVTGCAFQFKLGQTKNGEKTVYVSAVQQSSWNENTKTGSFSDNAKNPEKTLNIKLSVNELGGFIHAIRQYTDFSAFHTFEDNKTQISFKPYTKKDDAQTKAFSFSISRNGNQKFGIGIELAEAESLSEFFKFALSQIFSGRSNFSKQEE
jgi:hypothetical protein